MGSRLMPVYDYLVVTVCAVMEELAHIKKSTDNTKDAACQSRDDINADNTPAFRDSKSNPMVEEEYEVFNDEDMYCLSDSNTNSVEGTLIDHIKRPFRTVEEYVLIQRRLWN